MFLRTISAALLSGVLLLAPIASTAADRGPSTPEERKKALEYIRDFEANPLAPHAVEEREWVLRWIIEVPDIHVSVCMILDKLPKGDKKDASTSFSRRRSRRRPSCFRIPTSRMTVSQNIKQESRARCGSTRFC